jgi:lipopolysaccharide export system protein LptA
VRWQRAARWVVAVAGIGTAVALYTQTRERPAEDRPSVATPADPEAISQSAEGKYERYQGGTLVFSIEYDAIRRYESPARTEYDKARFRMDDGTFLAADRIVITDGEDGQPAESTFTGNVRMDTPEGASIRAAEATYANTTGVAVLPGPITFSRGRLSGRGTGGEYHRETGVFHVLADAHVESAADDAGGKVVATSRSMTFNRAGLALLFDQDARIAHEKQVMTADRATLYLAENQDQFRVIELRGRSTVTPVPGQEATVPEMRARDIDLSFHEGTQALERALLVGGSSMVLVEGSARRSIEAADITVTTAPDGRTVTHLDARERVTVRTPAQAKQAARTITSSTLVASGTDAGLTDATFTGGVRFVETTPAAGGRKAGERVGTSQALTMKLGGQLDAVESAQFQQNVQFRDGDVSGGADIGDYAASAGRLTLRPGRVASRLPRVTSGRVTVDARELIDVDLNTQNLHARGDVKTVSTPEPGARGGRGSASETGLFTSGETMFGFGAEFWYEGEAGRVRYRGAEKAPARVTQGDTVIVGVSVDLSEETQDLTAAGGVESTFLVADSKAPSAAPQKYRVQAETLEYRDKARTATYTGVPVILTAPDGVTRARTMVMALAAGSRTLERLDARTDVHAVMPNGREALADSLLYEASLDRYTLRGARERRLVLRAAGDSPGMCSVWYALMAHFTRGGGPPVFPQDQNPGGVERRDVACAGTLQR